MLDRKTINNYSQNRPSLIAKDLKKFGVPEDTTYRILLARGVFKWLAKRRDLIKIKNNWRARTTEVISMIRVAKAQKDHKGHIWLKGYLACLEDNRQDIGAICHGERWIAPDNDSTASRWLSTEEGVIQKAEATRLAIRALIEYDRFDQVVKP